MLKVKFEANVNGVLEEQNVPLPLFKRLQIGSQRELMKDNLWTDEERGCDEKYDVPEVVTGK